MYNKESPNHKSKNKISIWHKASCFAALFCLIILMQGCVSEKVDVNRPLVIYQENLVNHEPREGLTYKDPNQSLELLKPVASNEALPKLEITTDPNTGEKVVNLTLEEVIQKALSNSSEIRVVSYDPSISRLDITKAASEFDVTAFGDLNYDTEDNPENSIFQAGQSNARSIDAGLKQKLITGSEWSLTYAFTRNWDDLTGRTFSTRYEPILSFQLKQPLLRNGWPGLNLAGIDIAKLNYKIAMLGFRQKADDVTTQVISAYWQLLQTRKNLEIYKVLLDQTLETLVKVEGRRKIDATEVQIQQATAYTKSRQASLIEAEKQVLDQQDTLVRLMSDSQLNLLENYFIVPTSTPSLEEEHIDVKKLLETAMQKNPAIQQARAGIEIADINIRIAKNQRMPRLDLVTSLRTQSLAPTPGDATEQLSTGNYVSYAVGLSIEYPLGNRQREADLMERKLTRRKAAVNLENIADQAAQLTRQNARRVESDYAEIAKQKAASEAAANHLKVLQESEIIREKLTPEFLLLKLQAQEFLANAQLAEIRAIADYNIAIAELSRLVGTTLELNLLEPIPPKNTNTNPDTNTNTNTDKETNTNTDTNNNTEPNTTNLDELVPIQLNN
jgi:outer membrane protein